MINQWLSEQQQQGKTLYLMLDPVAEPNPLVTLLLAQVPFTQYAWLLQNTPYESLKDSSPTLLGIQDIHNHGLQELINHPERNWAGSLVPTTPSPSSN